MRPIVKVLTVLAAAAGLTGGAAAADKEDRVFELRVYYAAKGKLDALHARFRDHTCKLFEKHGMTNVGYWVPVENPDDRLVYVLAHKDREAARASWKGFIDDPDWKAAHKASEKDGKLVDKIEAVYMTATDYSPSIKADKADGQRVFEMRTYVASPGNLDNLNARFRDHTLKLFEKHGMTNVAYWTVEKGGKTTVGRLLTALSPAGQDKVEAETTAPAAPVALIYLISHKSADARNKSFDTFRADPDWLKARGESEKKAGGSLTAKDGVKSLMMKATDYSPMK